MLLKNIFQNICRTFTKPTEKKQLKTDKQLEEYLEEYLDSLDYPTGYVKLKGPLLSAQYATSHIEEYKATLCSSYYTINCRINRRIVVLTTSGTAENLLYQWNDNYRIGFGVNPHNHEIGMCIKEIKDGIDFTVYELDNHLLMGEDDRTNIKELLLRFPLTEKELDQWIKKEGI